MNPQEALGRAAAHLDDATENLTFGQYAWAFEEAWRGVAWALHAFGSPLPQLGPGGQVPAAGTLNALLAHLAHLAAPPAATRIVGWLEGKRAVDVDHGDVERMVFAAWELHDACGVWLSIPDDRLESKVMLERVSPGRVGSRVVHRRTVLKAIAASSFLPLVACDPAREPVPEPAVPPNVPLSEPVRTADARVKRVTPLGGQLWQTTDPFLFCAHHYDLYPAGNDHFGPAASLDGRLLGRDFAGKDQWSMYHGHTVPGFPRHPHRGFETVTFVRTGVLDHSDSMGAAARYGDGDVQWLTAGGGIQHAEMFPLLRPSAPNPLHLYQIWLNLPAADKMAPAHFAMLWSEKIPRVTQRDDSGKVTELTLAAGTYRGHTPPSPPPNSWACKARSDVAIWALRMEPGARFMLPVVAPGTRRTLYVHAGVGMRVAGEDVPANHRVEVDDHGPVALQAGAGETQVLLLQGRPIGEPVAKRGPFVMNTQEEIRRAYADYKATQFGGWPWGKNDPVHAGRKGRFARHIDGRVEEPT